MIKHKFAVQGSQFGDRVSTRALAKEEMSKRSWCARYKILGSKGRKGVASPSVDSRWLYSSSIETSEG